MNRINLEFALFCREQTKRLQRRFDRIPMSRRQTDYNEKRECAVERRGIVGGGGIAYNKRRHHE
jgi:hypothetical protein